MPRTTNRIASEFESVSAALVQLEQEPGFEGALKVVDALTSLLGISTLGTERLYNVDKIKQNPGWFIPAQGFADRRACYKLADGNAQNIDIKLYWVQKTSKRIISSAVMFTANFEDEPFNTDLNIGIDFFIPASADRVIMALSNRYLIRTLELQGSLGITQQEIFNKWIQNLDFANKTQTHKVLWESLDLQPLNKQFYKEVTRFFTELIQHLEKDTKLFQPKEAAQFTNRLIGRLIFCWFLRKKQIIADDHAHFELDDDIDSSAYYHNGLEKLFFSILNTKIEERDIEDKTTPFLNGGLFEARESDHQGNKELTFPKDYFHRFFQFLDGYNFTTDESTSEFQQVAIDPEMLGRIFENLLAEQKEETGQQARKAKGAFYTPREIVDYMCKESLREYIRTKLPDDNKRDQVLELLFDKKEHQLDYKSLAGNLKDYKKTILGALDEITVLDPACGSGAFPMGMLQLMLTIYERIDPRFDSYKTKLGIVKNNLFGVDIEPMAVEISRLRAWLSIIVDVDMNPTKENLGIEPLPNLEFKFVAANSLIPLESGGTEQMEFDNKNLQEEMSRIRDRYFNTNSGKVKEKMKLDYEKLLRSGNTIFKSDRRKKLLTYQPFDSSKSAGFFDPKLMFGLEGFDVVIGNPPYVSLEKVKENKDEYKKIYQTAAARGDLYCLFYERGLELTELETGILTFITSNKWMRAGYGKNLRGYFASKNPLKLLDFGGFKVFESATVDTSILLIKNQENQNHLEACHFQNDYKQGDDLKHHFDLNKVELKNISSDTWFIGNHAELDLKKKMEAAGTPLRDWDVKITRGIITGFNEAFIIDQAKQDELVAADPKSTEIIKPILRGRDIKRYGHEWSGLFIIITKFGSYKTLQTDYPAIYEHLKKYETKLKARGQCKYSRAGKNGAKTDYEGQHHWLELDNNPRDEYIEMFEKEKVVWPMVSTGQTVFSKVEPGTYLNNKCYLINGDHLSFILAVLNSKFAWRYFNSQEAGLGNHSLEIRKNGLENFPMPRKTLINEDSITQIEQIAESILIAKKKGPSVGTSHLENEIDELVMDLYQLTEEEKEIIWKS